MSLRVRVSREHGYDDRMAYQLNLQQHIDFVDGFGQDFRRVSQSQQLQNVAIQRPERSQSLDSLKDNSPCPEPKQHDEEDAFISDLCSLDLFGWKHDPSIQYIPIVDLWLNIEDHLSEETIPSPTELWEEQRVMHA